jgi:thioredoxin 1
MSDNKISFAQLINGEKPVMVDFSAEWCGPCKMMKPILAELKKMVGEHVTIIKVDVDSNPAISGLYQIQSVPTLVIFKKGQIIWRKSGVISAAQLAEALKQHHVF